MPKNAQTAKTEDIAAQFETLREDVAKLTEIVSEVSAAKVDSAKASAKKNAEANMERLSQNATHYKTMTEDSIRKQPVMATAVAATLGFAVGYLANRS
ncbi:MAG: DUF883 domain-containing protein [Rhodobacteraceae bacterium]|nr:DUF883 domain-containing protein [Paracoccaceae bacterium]MCW9044224.1 DUF883 domain-containing protein [Pseudopelagicola sp.]